MRVHCQTYGCVLLGCAQVLHWEAFSVLWVWLMAVTGACGLVNNLATDSGDALWGQWAAL